MAHGFLHLWEGHSSCAVVISVLTQSMVPSESVNVACKCREESSCEDLGSRADDGLHHSINIGIDSLECPSGDIVVQKSKSPAVPLEGIPTWIFRTPRRLLAFLVFVTRDALDETVLADSLGVICRDVHEGARRDEWDSVHDEIFQNIFSAKFDFLCE